MSTNGYINLLEVALNVIKNAHIPLDSCKYSRRTYTQPQLMSLIIFREIIREDYRDTVQLVDLMDRIKEILRWIRFRTTRPSTNLARGYHQ